MLAARATPQLEQRELVGEQFLERQPALGRMSSPGQDFGRGAGRRAVQEFERGAQVGQAQPAQQAGGSSSGSASRASPSSARSISARNRPWVHVSLAG